MVESLLPTDVYLILYNRDYGQHTSEHSFEDTYVGIAAFSFVNLACLLVVAARELMLSPVTRRLNGLSRLDGHVLRLANGHCGRRASL